MSADESAQFLTLALKNRTPFFYTKYGDGALECIYGLRQGGTRDLEKYSDGLAVTLRLNWAWLRDHPHLYLADWLSAKFDANLTGRYEEQYRDFVRNHCPTWLNYEAVHMDRTSLAVLDFYRALKQDERRKVLIGPEGWDGTRKAFGAQFVPLPPNGGVGHMHQDIINALESLQPEIIAFGAGMAGACSIIDYWTRHSNEDLTVINLGAAIDPLFRGKTRSGQLDPAVAKQFYGSLLNG